MISKILLKEFGELPGLSDTHLLSRISFETRSIAIPSIIPPMQCKSITAFVSASRSETAEANLNVVCELHKGGISVVTLEVKEPLNVAKVLAATIEEICVKVGNDPLIIDITSFRREELLMLLAILKLIPASKVENWRLAYVGAHHMGEWLSGEVTGVRSILGYPGLIKPSSSTRLIVLMGFEVGRARSIIENYEPKNIVLGMGRKTESINDQLYTRNKELFDQVALEFKESLQSTFEFSARDPSLVSKEIGNAVGNDQSSNIVIAPLHTKLSTVGAGIYALNHERVQVCYAPVEEYNESAYSAQGKDVYVVPLNTLFS